MVGQFSDVEDKVAWSLDKTSLDILLVFLECIPQSNAEESITNNKPFVQYVCMRRTNNSSGVFKNTYVQPTNHMSEHVPSWMKNPKQINKPIIWTVWQYCVLHSFTKFSTRWDFLTKLFHFIQYQQKSFNYRYWIHFSYNTRIINSSLCNVHVTIQIRLHNIWSVKKMCRSLCLRQCV